MSSLFVFISFRYIHRTNDHRRKTCLHRPLFWCPVFHIQSTNKQPVNTVHNFRVQKMVVVLRSHFSCKLKIFRANVNIRIKRNILHNVLSKSVIAYSVVNKHFVITNRFLGLTGHLTTQINPVITNPGYNKQKWPVPTEFDCIT